MKYLLLLLCLPLFASSQTDTSVIYKQSYSIKEWDAVSVKNVTIQFIIEQKEKFFYLNTYSKQPIDTTIDTSKYGYYKTTDTAIIANCVFVYKTNSIDVVYGDAIFKCKNGMTTLQLRNARYSKYEKQNGNWRETQRGLYKDLKLCKHCNVTGIKLAETVNKGFVRLSLAYETYLKKAAKIK